MSKKDKGTPVFSEIEIAAIAKCMIFPEEGVGLYLDMLSQKMKEQSTKVSEVLKEAKMAPAEEIPEEQVEEEKTREPFFPEGITENISTEISEENNSFEEVFVPPVIDETLVTDRNKTMADLEQRGLESLSKELLNDNSKLNNFIENYDFLKTEGINLDNNKLAKNFASLAIADPSILKQSYGKIIANGYSIVKPNGNLSLVSLLVAPEDLDTKFEVLRNAEAEDFYKLYPEYISQDASKIANRINYCKSNNIEYKTKVNDKDIYLPVILLEEEFKNAGGVE